MIDFGQVITVVNIGIGQNSGIKKVKVEAKKDASVDFALIIEDLVDKQGYVYLPSATVLTAIRITPVTAESDTVNLHVCVSACAEITSMLYVSC